MRVLRMVINPFPLNCIVHTVEFIIVKSTKEEIFFCHLESELVKIPRIYLQRPKVIFSHSCCQLI